MRRLYYVSHADVEIDPAVPVLDKALALAIHARRHWTEGRTLQAESYATQAHELVAVHGAELFDRIVIEGTFALVLSESDRERAKNLVRDLRRRLRRENGKIEALIARSRHRFATTRLLEAALTIEGPLYPRISVRSESWSETAD